MSEVIKHDVCELKQVLNDHFGRMNPNSEQKRTKPQCKRDGFTWDDVRKVFDKYKISNYYQAIEILNKNGRIGADDNDQV